MNIAVIGAGGVGGYFGAKIANAGYNVTLVARGEHGNKIKQNGLKVLSPKGDFTVSNINVVDSVSKLEDIDFVIIGTKAWQVKGIAEELKPLVKPSTIVLPLQNGVMAVPDLLSHFPENNVFGGLCSIFSKIEEPGVINHMSATPTVVFGELDNSLSERAKSIKAIFDDADIKSTLSDYIQGAIWKKFLMICLGGLGALTRSNFGVLRSTPELRNMLVNMLEEMYEVSQAEGIKLDRSIIEKSMQNVDGFEESSNSSMARDVWAKRPSELEYQNGSVVALANKHGIKVSVNSFIYYCLLPQEQEARK